MFPKTQATQRLKVSKMKNQTANKMMVPKVRSLPTLLFCPVCVITLNAQGNCLWIQGTSCQHQVAGRLKLPSKERFP